MREPTEEDIRAILGEEISEDDIRAILAPPSLEPLQEAVDIIPESERIPPVYSQSAIQRLFGSFISPDVPIPGLHAGQPAPVFELSEITGQPPSEVSREVQAATIPGIVQGIRTLGAPELFVQGALAYWLETEPARIMRKGYRYLLPPGERIKGKEPTKPLSIREMIRWGVASVTGSDAEVEDKAMWLRMVNRAMYTQEEIDAQNAWFERHKGIRRARTIGELTTEFVAGAAFDWALAAGAKGATEKLYNFFSTAKPGILKKGFAEAVIAQADELGVVPLKGVPFVSGVSVHDVPGLSALDDIDTFSKTQLYRSYLNNLTRVQETAEEVVEQGVKKVKKIKSAPIVPQKVMDSYVDAISFGTTTDINKLNSFQLEQLVDDVSVYVGAKTQDMKLVTNFIDRKIAPSWKTFEKLGLFKYFADVDDGQRAFHDFFNNSMEYMKHVKKQYKKQFGSAYGVEADTAASYLAEHKILPKKVRDDLAASIGAKVGDDIYDDQIDFLTQFVEVDRAWYTNTLRDEAVRQGKIGPGTDVPVVDYYLYQLTKDRAKERMTKARTTYRASGMETRFIDTTPRDMYAPEFLKRKRDIPDSILENSYETRRYLFHRDEGRKLYIQPPVDRVVAQVENLTGEATEHNKMIRQWLSEWVEKGVYAVPTNWDAQLNADLNRISKVIESKTGGRWTATGRAAEHALEITRRGVSRAVLMANLRPMFKNLFQGLLAVPYIGSKATMAGYASVLTRGGRGILDDMGFIAARGPLGSKVLYGALDISTAKGWETLLSYGHIAAVDRYMNVPAAFNGYLWHSITGSRRKMQELIDFGASMGARANYVKGAGYWDVLREAIRAGHFKQDVLNARALMYNTQWFYGRVGTSPYLWGSLPRALFQFSTWPAHYTTVYIRQLLGQFVTGKTMFGTKVGLTDMERYALLKYIGMTAGLAYAGSKAGINMNFLWSGVLGTGMGPAGDFAGSLSRMAEGALTKQDRQFSEGWNGLLYQLPVILGIPAFGTIKKAWEIEKGEREPYELFWTPTKEEERARQPLPTRPSPSKPRY